MATTVFAEADSVFFVGGTGTKAGIGTPGGCTKEWYDAQSPFALTDIMGTNGGALVGITGALPDADGITMTKLGECGSVEAGMIAYLSGTDVANGRYRVVSATANTIVFPAATFTGITEDIVCNVGGAFDTLQNAVDNCDASQAYNVHIFDNKPETLAAAIDFDTTGGSIANNSQMIVEGFSALPGDMNYGGTYYQGPLHCLINGVDANKCVTLDADGGAYDVIAINNFDGLVLKNFYFYNTNKAVGHNCIELLVTYSVHLGFINCKFDKARSALGGAEHAWSTIFLSCYMGNDFGYAYMFASSIQGGGFKNCVFNGDGLSGIRSPSYGTSIGCLFWKSDYGAFLTRPHFYESCVFYGQTYCCVRPNDTVGGAAQGQNNIFMPEAAADYVVYAPTAVGSVCDETLRKSCIWTIAGVAVTNHISINSITRQLSDVIEEDPQFVDAPNGDFRLKINSPCLKTGMKTLGAV